MAEEFNDIFEGYENDLQKAVALVEWQKSEIESLTVKMNAFGLAAKRLAEERQEVMHITYDDLAEFVEVRIRCENTRKKSMCKYCPFYDRCDIDDNENLHVMCCAIKGGGEE